MEYTRISADCHSDSCWMPPEIVCSEAPSTLKERMPLDARAYGVRPESFKHTEERLTRLDPEQVRMNTFDKAARFHGRVN